MAEPALNTTRHLSSVQRMHWHGPTLVDTIICLSSADMHGSAVPRMNHCTCVLSHANINRQNENQFISFRGGVGANAENLQCKQVQIYAHFSKKKMSRVDCLWSSI